MLDLEEAELGKNVKKIGTQAQWKKLQPDTVFNPDFINIEYNFASDKVDEHIWSKEKIYDEKMIRTFMTVQRVEPRVIIAQNAAQLIKTPQSRSRREVRILTDHGK